MTKNSNDPNNLAAAPVDKGFVLVIGVCDILILFRISIFEFRIFCIFLDRNETTNLPIEVLT